MAEKRTPETTAAFRQKMTRNLVLLDPEPKISTEHVCDFLGEIAVLCGAMPSNFDIHVGEKWYFPSYKRGVVDIANGKFEKCSHIGLLTTAFKSERADVVFMASVDFQTRFLKVHYGYEHGDLDTVRDIIKFSCRNFKFSLGYYWEMENKYSPINFGGTVINLSTPEKLRLSQSNFSECFRKGLHRKGFFRDIFRMNILSESHLEMSVQGVKFVDWVEQASADRESGAGSTTRGRLSRISDKNWLWEVEQVEFDNILRTMADAGVIMSMIDLDTLRGMLNQH